MPYHISRLTLSLPCDMSLKSEKCGAPVNADVNYVRHEDDVRLAHLGYKSEFKREFSVRTKCDYATTYS